MKMCGKAENSRNLISNSKRDWDINRAEMKIRKEFLRKIRKILGSKLNGKKHIINIFYGGCICAVWCRDLEICKAELKKLDRKTRKLLTIYGAHRPRANVDGLYLRRTKRGRGLCEN